ncbi:MAG: hypothetical protein A4E60_03395 [Syntrophorhabdus sp. PtaB.Bin047]|jgi:hypothetical protein|nr:MAG: hypothetical protein A4E60_03395 [Syntrophorhabdus sp. PtaB.Bin047]
MKMGKTFPKQVKQDMLYKRESDPMGLKDEFKRMVGQLENSFSIPP